MLALSTILSVLCVFFAAIAIFLGLELLKKFGFMRDFVQNSNQLISWRYKGLLPGRKPGMRNIVLRGRRPFAVLVGFELRIPLLNFISFDYYGFVRSDQQSVAVISTYMGKGSCEFQFFANKNLLDNPIIISSTDDDQHLTPDATYPPHWWQRLHFYG